MFEEFAISPVILVLEDEDRIRGQAGCTHVHMHPYRTDTHITVEKEQCAFLGLLPGFQHRKYAQGVCIWGSL